MLFYIIITILVLLIFSLACFLLFVHIVCRLTSGYTRSSACLVGKTALVTGGNEGIGYQTCLNLASRGCRVIIADVEDCEESVEKIIQYSHNENIAWKKVDLRSFSSVRKLAEELNSSEDKLDILIHNAVIVGHEELLTEDGFNPILQVNYFSPFLLTHLLLGLLKKGAPSRVVFGGSIAAYSSSLKDAKQLTSQREKSIVKSLRAYADSKLAEIFACEIFAKRLTKKYRITFNSHHTGVVATKIFHKFKEFHPDDWFFGNLGIFVSNTVGKNLWQGSQTTTHLAISNKLQDVSGKFFLDCREVFKPLQVRNKKLVADVWNATEEAVKLKPNEKI